MQERVLVVDDAPEIRSFLSEYILKPRGFEVLTATNGLEGLALAVAKNPHLMILDMQMPRLNGLDLLQRLRDRGMEVPTILMTAHGSEEVAVAGFRLGIRDYVIKPFDIEEMDVAIERALRENRLRRERDELVQQLMESNTQTKKRLQELNILYGIGRSVSSNLNLDEILDRVVDAGVFVTGADEGALLLLKPDQDALYLRAMKNMKGEKGDVLGVNPDSPVRQVILSHRPLIAGRDIEWENLNGNRVAHSHAYVPLLANGKPIGVLGVANRQTELKFDNRDTRMLSALADYAALAVANGQRIVRDPVDVSPPEQLFLKTADPMLILDNLNDVRWINKSARRLFFVADDNVIGMPISRFITNVEFLEYLDQHDPVQYREQFEYEASDGRIFNARMSLIENDGRVIILRDITKLKELDKLKSEFVSIVSHDLRSPLTSIMGYVELLDRTGSLNETQQEFVKRISRSVRNITTLITELLDLGRLESGLDLTLVSCDLPKLLQDIVSTIHPKLQEKQLNLVWNVSPDLPPVKGDSGRLKQAFTNLLDNAVKYSKAGGNIGVRAELQDEQLLIEISDTGIGISLEEQHFIFDRFFRSELISEDYEGTGLGLSIVKSVVAQHQGRIWVTSALGAGATFTVVLPPFIED